VIQPPQEKLTPNPKLLLQDKKVVELVLQEHSALIIMTQEAMEALLRLLGEYGSEMDNSC
jgi:hypothetical protein